MDPKHKTIVDYRIRKGSRIKARRSGYKDLSARSNYEPYTIPYT